MSTKTLTIVGLRLLAVYCFVQSVPVFASFVFLSAFRSDEIFRTSPAATFMLELLPGLSLLLLAVLLYVFSAPLARRLAPAESAEEKEVFCTFEQLQAIAFAVAGILVLAMALPLLGNAINGLASACRERAEAGVVPSTSFYGSLLYFMEVMAQFGLGLVLLLSPRGLRNLWRGLRRAGT